MIDTILIHSTITSKEFSVYLINIIINIFKKLKSIYSILKDTCKIRFNKNSLNQDNILQRVGKQVYIKDDYCFFYNIVFAIWKEVYQNVISASQKATKDPDIPFPLEKWKPC